MSDDSKRAPNMSDDPTQPPPTASECPARPSVASDDPTQPSVASSDPTQPSAASNDPTRMPGPDETLRVEQLSFSYSESREILRDVSFSMSSGDIVSILGPNGSGKTTLLDCIMSLLKPTGGRVLLEGETTDRMGPRDVAQLIGYVPQNIIPSFDYAVIDYVVTGCAPHLKLLERPGPEEYAIADRALESMGIAHLRNDSYARISGGERQQVSIARVLAQRPRIILLDEPTSHLDFGNQARVLSLVKGMAAEGFGIVMTTHNPDQALMLGGKLAVIGRDGSFRFGRTEEVITEPFLRDLYQTDLLLVDVPAAQRSVCVIPKLG